VSRTLDRADLDRSVCAHPGCTEDHVLYLVCRTHGSRVRARYEKATGDVVVECAACKSELARILVGYRQ